MAKKSEFGKGFIYNLILFSKHWWRHSYLLETNAKMKKTVKKKSEKDLFSEANALEIWFNGASDHLYELEIPKKWQKKEIGKLAKWIQNKSLLWGHGFKENLKSPSKADFIKMFEKIEKLARLIDKELGVETKKARWN